MNHQAGRQKNGKQNDRQPSGGTEDGCQSSGQVVGREIRTSPNRPGMLSAVTVSPWRMPTDITAKERMLSRGMLKLRSLTVPSVE